MQQPPDIPPKLATWLLYRFLRSDLAEDVSGDLEERYYGMITERSRLQARFDYWYQVLHYLRPFAIRKLSRSPQLYHAMYKSYFITSVRAMKKNKLHAAINIAGLSVGMAVAMIIGLWIHDELSYEKHFERYDRIGRVIQNVTNNGQVDTWWSVPWPLADELRKKYGDNFTHVVLATSVDEEIVSYEDKHLRQPGIFAEPGYSDLFTLPMVRGSRPALNDPSSILVSESFAKTYFGNTDPLGKVMMISDNMTVNVGGVYQDIPEQSELHNIHFIAPWDLLYNNTGWIKGMQEPWRPNAFDLYVALAPNRTFEAVSANIKDAKLKNLNAELAKKKPELFVHPMRQWHLYSRFRNGHPDGGLITYVWLFAIIGIFVVLMACMNFMNLSTARSEKRAKEVGIRKAIGSYRSQLIQQFFSESVFTALLSFILAVLLVQLSLPFFNLMAGKHTALPWGDISLWAFAIGLCVVIGIVAGSYPALYLSSITPRKALKGAFKTSKGAAVPRKIMVVVQFAVSVIMIIGTAVVFLQIQHAKDRPMGYDSNGLITVQTASNQIHQHLDAVRQELQQGRVIVDVAEANSSTTEQWSSSSAFTWEGKDPDLSIDFANAGVSANYGQTIGWEIVQGRDFSRDFLSDSSSVIINEAAANYMGFKHAAGETLYWYNEPNKIIGVVKDIVTNSPFEPVRPMIYYILREKGNVALFKIHPEQSAQQALAELERVYKKYIPEQPFTYRFVDEAYAQKFGNEERVGKLAGVFTSLAIFISCLGIFGLSSFIAEQRTKEIGIRKVHGATVFQVWKMVSTDFVVLVIIACIIAMPIAYMLSSQWVNRYNYHISISWAIPVLAAIAILAITLITVSWHTLQAARMNPVKTLRSE
ncbi:MAG TPA: ABC transporter permease [Ohtaekwangia sp.]|uniref:ABC transporter permease n=1 Tax=Ohtaekwangia sp. TaxID=2066019 RepID=UPI002F92691D